MNIKNALTLKQRYFGSYLIMAYGLAMVIIGHLRSAVMMTPVGELMLYGALLYHARKRQRFESRIIWPALEVYAGLSMAWMIVNILRIRIWQWQPIAFGLVPTIAITAYAFALLGKRHAGEMGRDSTPRHTLRQIPVLLTIAALWVFLNFYALPRLQIST